MAYGLEVYDSLGSVTGSGIRLGRILAVITHNGASQVAQVIPDYNETAGFIHWTRVTYSGDPFGAYGPDITWNNATSTLTVSPNGLSGTAVVGMRK